MESLDWKPTRITRERIYNSLDEKVAFKAFRSSSSAYIKRKDVRDAVFSIHGKSCVKCNSEDEIQIDHIKSVYFCFHNKQYLGYCNTVPNLVPLCSKCNIKKSH